MEPEWDHRASFHRKDCPGLLRTPKQSCTDMCQFSLLIAFYNHSNCHYWIDELTYCFCETIFSTAVQMNCILLHLFSLFKCLLCSCNCLWCSGFFFFFLIFLRRCKMRIAKHKLVHKHRLFLNPASVPQQFCFILTAEFLFDYFDGFCVSM